MYFRFIIISLGLLLLISCKQDEVLDESIIEIGIANPNRLTLAITTEDDVFLDSLAFGDTLHLSINAQPFTYFKAVSSISPCAKDFTYLNGFSRPTITTPLFSQCDDGDLYIISVLDTLEYDIIAKVLERLYPHLPKVNIYQRTADADNIIDFTKYSPETSEIERDTLKNQAIDSATTADYWVKNGQYDRWYNFRDSRISVIPRSEMNCLLRYYDLNAGGLNQGDYECKYPDTPLFQFSRVGLNQNRSQALVSFFDSEQTRRVLLELLNNEWQLVADD